jgi:transcriptional regulator with XRE-family HTH domain
MILWRMPKKDPLLVAFGHCVRRNREGKSFSQEKLAELADLDRTYISGIERGTRNPGIKNVAKLARALGASVAELCEGVS